MVLAVAYVVAGMGLFGRRAWARKLALALLVVATFYAANDFAWGVAGGPPTAGVYLLGGTVVAAWNGLGFYLIYRASSAAVLS